MATREPQAPQAPTAVPTPIGDLVLELQNLVATLRSPHGCPWDREQTSQSLIPYMLEETYEVIESIEANDPQALREELGDLILHVVFQSRLAEEQQHFTFSHILQGLIEKLIRRHPHVFSDAQVQGTDDVRQRWETAKQREKDRASLLDGIPRTLPALTRARRVQEKAASVGFDWPDMAPVWSKVREEMQELQAAYAAADTAAIHEEFGDVLFSLVNLGRFLQLNPEDALRQAIAKFERRFQGIEQELSRRGRGLEEATLAEMDAIWNRLRAQEKRQHEGEAAGQD